MADEYVIPLSIDVEALLQRSKAVKTELVDIGNESKKTGQISKDALYTTGLEYDKVTKKIVEQAGEYQKLTKNVTQLEIQLQSYQRIAKTSLDPKIITEYNQKAEALKTQISQLSNSGKQGFNELGQAVEKNSNFLTSAFSKVRQLAYILPGVGIAGIIGFATGPIIEYLSKLDFVKNALETLTAQQKVYAQAFQDTGYQKAISNISELTENIKLAKEGFLDKTKVLKQYNTELGASIGYANSLDEAEQNIVRNGKDFIQVTLLKAAAQIALGDAAKKLAEAAQIQAKPTEEFSSIFELPTQNRTAQDVKASEANLDAARKARQAKQVKELNDNANAQLKIFDDFQKRAADIARKNGKIDFFDGTQDPDKEKKEKDNTDQILARRKALLDQLVKLQNDFTSAQIAGIEDAETKEVALNDVNYQNKIRTLKQQQQDLIAEAKRNKFPSLLPLIQDNIRELSLLIAQEEQKGQADSLAIINKYAALKLKAQQDSLRQIGVLLKDETSARIEGVKANYEKVIIEAKKNGVLTDDLLKKLARQEQSDISDIQSKAVLDRLKETNELEIAFANSEGRRPGELQATFEEELQRKLLAIDLKYQKQRIGVLAATAAQNGGLTPEQTKQLADATSKLNKDTGATQSNAEADHGNLLKTLGFSNDSIDSIHNYSAAMAEAGKITSDFITALEAGADARIASVQKQIDAIDQLLQADQAAVDKQQALFDKGRANSLDAAKKTLADDQAQKNKLQKQLEAAQKKKEDLQKAALLADSVAQVSNLVTAASGIFQAFAKIPFVGVALGIAAVAAMFAAFGVAKANAFSAVSTQTAEEGGVAGGDRHSSGGNKYVSMDGKDKNILEIERGERIFSRKNSEKHKKLFEAIQNNDYSKLDISDVSIRDLLRGTGVMQQLEVAQRVGNQNITLQDRANSVVIVTGNSDKYLSSIDKKMDGLNRREPIIIDYGDYVWIDHGNGYTEKRYK